MGDRFWELQQEFDDLAHYADYERRRRLAVERLLGAVRMIENMRAQSGEGEKRAAEDPGRGMAWDFIPPGYKKNSLSQ